MKSFLIKSRLHSLSGEISEIKLQTPPELRLSNLSSFSSTFVVDEKVTTIYLTIRIINVWFRQRRIRKPVTAHLSGRLTRDRVLRRGKKAMRTQRAIELESVKRQTSTPAYLAQIGILLLNGNVGLKAITAEQNAGEAPGGRRFIFRCMKGFGIRVMFACTALDFSTAGVNWVLCRNATQMLASLFCFKKDISWTNLMLYAAFDAFLNKNCSCKCGKKLVMHFFSFGYINEIKCFFFVWLYEHFIQT